LARDVSALLPPGARVLDLGCGEGRDSVFFAECGFDVTGVDIARSGLSKAERLAHARRVRVHWICSDLGGLDVSRLRDGFFDLIYSCGAIHYLPRVVRARLFPRLKAVTPESGLHAQIVFTDRSVYVEKGERIDYFAPGELTGLYADWLILAREERLIGCSQDGTIHHHSVEQLIARAPRRA
jgi:tellurite methyltransferase